MNSKNSSSPLRTLPNRNLELRRMWDRYAEPGRELIYPGGPSKGHLKKLIELFVPCTEGDIEKIAVDVACGTGALFPVIIDKIKPDRLDGIDWSEKMLKKAEKEIMRLQKRDLTTRFNLFCLDVSNTPLPYPDKFVSAVVSNLAICYIPSGWTKHLTELSRILRNKGHLYIGTLLDTWTFGKVPLHDVKDPTRARKYREMIAQISKEAKKYGAEFPSREQLTHSLKTLEFKNIKITFTFHGNGLVLRAQKIKTP